jgi:hypothetical protein
MNMHYQSVHRKGWSCGREKSQRGITLLVSLIMLAVLALFGVSAIRSSLVNLRIAGNNQYQIEAQIAAQRAVDDVISSLNTFTAPSATDIVFSDTASTPAGPAIDATGGGKKFDVTISAPKCVFIKAADGYSYSLAAQAPKNTTWRITSTATDAETGAAVVIRQGVKVQLPTNATCN